MLRVEVRKNNIIKAGIILGKKVKEDGDLRRSIERSEFIPKSERKRLKSIRARKYRKVERMDEELLKNHS